jgi:LuxR family maltose regulon positive regulatory protein
MEIPILATKYFIPKQHTVLVARPHLVQRSESGTQYKLILVAELAGFGKTTLVSSWVSQIELPVAWVSLDKTDNDFRRFLCI